MRPARCSARVTPGGSEFARREPAPSEGQVRDGNFGPLRQSNLRVSMNRTLTCLLLAVAALASAQTSPKAHLGSNLGDDYFLANYQQLTTYWQKLAGESPRMKVESMGKTEEGRDQWMAIISDPENMRSLGRYKEIAGKLARAEGIGESEARALAAEGKSIVWIYALSFVFYHAVACLAFFPYFFSWTGVIVAVIGFYVFGTLGINLCYHRLLTHQGFVVPKWLERTFATLGESIQAAVAAAPK